MKTVLMVHPRVDRILHGCIIRKTLKDLGFDSEHVDVHIEHCDWLFGVSVIPRWPGLLW